MRYILLLGLIACNSKPDYKNIETRLEECRQKIWLYYANRGISDSSVAITCEADKTLNDCSCFVVHPKYGNRWIDVNGSLLIFR